jgi:hypothetical protein
MQMKLVNLFTVLVVVLIGISLSQIIGNAISRNQVPFPDAINQDQHSCTVNVQDSYYYDYRVMCAILITPGNGTYPACIDLKDSTEIGVHLCYTNTNANCRQPIQCHQRYMSTVNYIYCTDSDSEVHNYYTNFKEPNTYEFGCICPDNPEDFLCTMEIIKHGRKDLYVSYGDVRYTFYHTPSVYTEYNNTQIKCYDSSHELNFDFEYIDCQIGRQEAYFDSMMIWVYVIVAVVSLCAVLTFAYGLYYWRARSYESIQ